MLGAYAGIGSRETPMEYRQLMSNIAEELANAGFILRSGGASGADEAFEIGCDRVRGNKEIYLPWKGFNGSDSILIVKDKRAFDIARKYHPNYSALKQGAQKLMARNSHQILGLNLESPVDFVICWTKDGKGQGGTGQALRIAKDYDIPVFDCGNYGLGESEECLEDLYNAINQLIDNEEE